MSPTRTVPGSVAVKSCRSRSGDLVGLAVAVGEVHPPRAGLAGHELRLMHEVADRLRAGGDAAAAELGVHSPVAASLVGVGEHDLDLLGERGPAGSGS